MIATLAYTVTTTLRSRTHTLQRSCTVYENGFNNQLGLITTFICLLPVADGTYYQLAQRNSGMLGIVLQHGQGFLYDVA